LTIQFIAFKKLHLTEDWKQLKKGNDDLFSVFVLDSSKGYITYTDLNDEKITKKFIFDTTIQISGNCIAIEEQPSNE